MPLGRFISKRTGTVAADLNGFVSLIHIFLHLQTLQHMHLFFRFEDALEQFSDSLQMVKNQITPGKLTWPLTKEIVKETQPDYFKVCC